MKNTVLRTALIITLFVILVGAASAQPAPKAEERVTLELGVRRELRSTILKSSRWLLISLPRGYETGKERYPVVFTLDGRSNFEHTTAAARFLALTGVIPPVIVVGIESPDRGLDYTPPSTSDRPPPGITGKTGGAPQFLEFIEKEVVPLIEKDYRVQPFRALIGHSLGGLFATYAYYAKPELFKGVVALDPSVFWNQGQIARDFSAYLSKEKPESGRRYFLGRTATPREIWTEDSKVIVAAVERMQKANALFTFLESPSARAERLGESHETMVYPASYLGLKFLFSDFSFRSVNANLVDPNIARNLTLADIRAYYDDLSKKYGYRIPIPEDVLSRHGTNMAFTQQPDKAIEALQLNCETYPRSINARTTLGQVAMRLGRKELARQAYEAAYKLALETASPAAADIKAILDGLGKEK